MMYTTEKRKISLYLIKFLNVCITIREHYDESSLRKKYVRVKDCQCQTVRGYISRTFDIVYESPCI